MSAFIDAVRSKGGRALWLDATDYTARLLARGAPPWLDIQGYVAWQRKARALLHSDVVSVPIARVADAWVAADHELEQAMRSKRRTTYPLQQLLASRTLREHLVSLVRDLRTSCADRILALTLPTPRSLLGAAFALAHADEPPAIDTDDAETAAMYVADFLRSFAASSIDAVLIEELSTTPSPSAAEYQPLINLAKHYRWDLGVRTHMSELVGENTGIDFAITRAPLRHLIHGIEIDQRFWSDAAPPEIPAGSFRFAQVPDQLAPELVLERLAVLRLA